MSTLEEDLRALLELAPKLPVEAKAATEAAIALRNAANPLRDEIQAVAEAAEEASHVASGLGQAFAKHTNELEQHLHSVLDEANSSWRTAQASLSATFPQTVESMGKLTQAKDGLVDRLMAADKEMDPTTEAENATKSLADAAETAKNDLDREANEFATAMTTLEEILGDRVPRLNTAAEALMKRLEDYHDKLEEQASTLISTMAAKGTELENALRASLDWLSAELENHLNLAAGQLADQVDKPLEEAGDGTKQALAALGTTTEERDKALATARAEFVQAFADLEAMTQPMPETMDAIHQAYEKVDGL